ncbi:GHKL domain-containing protein [Cellvibrio sp. KY-GH-1]|uniref:sensor histidine kinase n=1 Tax=Cellvibrio sp. KY-GH-1 TaxID=2303332 RepID=UPI001247952A|nr:sensor histidine kinase [Cellvibrio sp. KY-GH-1]QEY18777.1 GHKL domain-containing protein [Cellvibrio sp. KY-GH-1]
MIQYLITAIIDIVVGMLAISKKDNPAAKALGLTICCLGFWSLELYFLTSIGSMDVLQPLFHITRWGMFLAPSFFTLLTWRLLGSRSRSFRNLIVIPSFIMSVSLSLGNAIIAPSELAPTDGGYLPKPDLIYYAFGGYFIWCFFSSLVFVAVSYKTALSREKQRLKWVLITLLVCFFIGILLIQTMPHNYYLSKFMGPISNIVFVAFLFYSTIQHNLMDFRLALSVGLTKAILLGFFVWLYFVVTSVVGDHTESNGGILVLLMFVALILEAYPRLLKWILPSAKKILVKNGYDFDQVKAETEIDLKNSISFSMLIDVLDHLFLKVIKTNNYKVLMIQKEGEQFNNEGNLRSHEASFGTISHDTALVTYCRTQTQLILADEMPDTLQEEMKKLNASLCIPIASGNEAPAILMVGDPTNFTYYRYEDLKIFEWLKSELGQVLSRLIRLNHMQEQLGEAKKTLSMLSLMNHYHHDIKVPFAIIDGVLSNDIYDRDKQRDIVLEQVERGSKLIATMASILGGKHKRRIHPCSLESLIQDCLYLLEKSFDNVTYEFGAVQKVNGDAEDLKILFINLIKNAAEARRDNTDLTLTIKSWENDEKVFFSIQDSGIGMSEQQLANLWEPGFSAKKLGNGIGMQAVKRIINEHNAQIEVSSELNEGSKFTLTFLKSRLVDESLSGEQTKDELAERRASYAAEKRFNQ